MATTTPAPAAGRGKTSIAAGIFAVAFILSASLMVWSGWQLYHGEHMPTALMATGTQCDWVLLIDDPQQAPQTWQALHDQTDLPAAATPLWQALQPLMVAAPKTALNRHEAWVLCGLAGGAVLTVTNGPQQPEAAEQLVTLLAAEPTATGALIPWQHGTVVASTQVVRIAFSQAGADSQAMLSRSTPQGGPLAPNLATDLPFRASTERVGDAALHFYLPTASAQRWLKTLTPSLWWHRGMEVVQWLGVMVRLGEGHLRVHAHLGGDEQMGAWLKPAFDVPAMEDAAPWLAQTAQAAAIVRIPAKTRPQLAAWYGPDAPLLRQVLAQSAADLPVDTLIWQRFANGEEAAMWQGNASGPKDLRHAQEGAWTLLATSDAALTSARDVLQGKAPSLAKIDDRDRQRLLATTQGWFIGKQQVDWIWTDAGVAAEVAWQLPSQ